MNVLSLFDGISCGQIALHRAGIHDFTYYASEIKKNAIKCTLTNYPDTIEVGDVTKVHYENGTLITENGWYYVGHIDLLIGGSPCQDFSRGRVFDKKHNDEDYGLNGQRSRLFYEYLRLKEEIWPTYFLLENVKMRKESEKELNEYMGVDGLHIDSRLVSYQQRPRIYWTNIPNVAVPEDRGISFQDFKDSDPTRLEEARVNRTRSREEMWNNGQGRANSSSPKSKCPNVTYADKIGCLTRKQDRSPNSGLIEYKDFCRYLTRRELEGAQTLPPGYTDCLSYLQVQDVTGDGWTVDVIAHIFKGLGVAE